MKIFLLLCCTVFAVMMVLALLVRVLHAQGYGSRLNALAAKVARAQARLERSVILPTGHRLLTAARSCAKARSYLGAPTHHEQAALARLEQRWLDKLEKKRLNHNRGARP